VPAAFTFTTIDVPGAAPGSTRAAGINNPGQIVGSFAAGATTHGFLDTGGSFTTIEVPAPPPPPGTVASGINDAGQIVGYFNDGTFDHGFLDTGGSFTIIDVPSTSFNIANGINGAGQIVGTFESSFAVEHGFLATPVPEPSGLAPFSIGVIVLWIIRRRKCRQPIRLRFATTVGPLPGHGGLIRARFGSYTPQGSTPAAPRARSCGGDSRSDAP
jgi:probable HAF family extracellular repeat protein